MLPPHLAAVLHVTIMHDTLLLRGGSVREHAVPVALVPLELLPQHLRAREGQRTSRESLVVVPPAAAAYMSLAGAPTTSQHRALLYQFLVSLPNKRIVQVSLVPFGGSN